MNKNTGQNLSGNQVEAVAERLSSVAKALEDVYQSLMRHWPELPPVAITIFRDRRRSNLLGYFWNGQWQCAGGQLPELHISSTLLDEPAATLLCVLVHEAVHARATALGVRDTSRNGRYHNGRFAELAEEMGLVVAYDRSHGWYTPAVEQEWLDGTYAGMVERLERATGRMWQEPLGQHSNGRRGEGQPERLPAKRAGRLLKALCRCRPPRIIRAARSTFEQAPLICGACWEKFHLDV